MFGFQKDRPANPSMPVDVYYRLADWEKAMLETHGIRVFLSRRGWLSCGLLGLGSDLDRRLDDLEQRLMRAGEVVEHWGAMVLFDWEPCCGDEPATPVTLYSVGTEVRLNKELLDAVRRAHDFAATHLQRHDGRDDDEIEHEEEADAWEIMLRHCEQILQHCGPGR